MTPSNAHPVGSQSLAKVNRGAMLGRVVRTPTVGPLIVLLVFCTIFSLSTRTFFAAGNISLIVQQSVIIGTLAIGQTMIILTAGIDLTNGGIAVLGDNRCWAISCGAA